MFPEDFVERHVLAHSKPGDLVLDPFCGRGTTVFQSLLMGRRSAGIDINPVAACIAGAKSNPPTLIEVLQRVEELQRVFQRSKRAFKAPSAFFEFCFHENTLRELLFLRKTLAWRIRKIDRFVAALVLGALHGESHRSERYLSNRMPRTISTKPEYSVRWWQMRGLVAPERDTFSVLREAARFRLRVEPARLIGEVRLADARKAHRIFAKYSAAVRLIVTSPPYLDVTDYAEDQWLRLWFLGGEPYPSLRLFADDRLTSKANYWSFLSQVWASIQPLLAAKSRIVVRIGGHQPRDELAMGLQRTLKKGLTDRRIALFSTPLTSEAKRRQTNIFRPGAAPSVEHDFVFTVS